MASVYVSDGLINILVIETCNFHCNKMVVQRIARFPVVDPRSWLMRTLADDKEPLLVTDQIWPVHTYSASTILSD